MDPASSKKEFTANKAIIIILIAAIVVLLGSVVYLMTRSNSPLISQNQVQQNVNGSISGTFDINGVVPEGATISLTESEFQNKSDSPTVFMSGIRPVDGAAWSFNDGVAGKTYVVQASLVQNGATIAQSSPITVTAPATEESLTLNVTSQTTSQQANSVISGNIDVNGYIPSGSTIVVQGKKLGAPTFTVVASALPGKAKQYMSYTTAIAGQTYEVQGILKNSAGTVIGTSSTLIVTAPALNEALVVNSSATPPAAPTQAPQPTASQQSSAPTPTPVPAPAVISGNINFNGQAPANSRIAIFQKVYNTSTYQLAVDNIPPVNGSTWQWNSPQASTWYDMVAILKQRQSNGTDTDLSDSQVVSIAAPAANVQFNINSGTTISAPGGPISVTCGNVSGNTWGATLSFGAVPGAQSYWFQAGTSNGGTQLMNQTQGVQNNNNQAQTIGVNLQRNTTYYVAYAYSNVAGQGTGSNSYSPFSSTTQINCN